MTIINLIWSTLWFMQKILIAIAIIGQIALICAIIGILLHRKKHPELYIGEEEKKKVVHNSNCNCKDCEHSSESECDCGCDADCDHCERCDKALKQDLSCEECCYQFSQKLDM